MELTLFGVVESKSEVRARARELRTLQCDLADLPVQAYSLLDHARWLRRFIEMAEKIELDPNAQDGMYRRIGHIELDPPLSTSECSWMQKQNRFWKPTPRGFECWCGTKRLVKKRMVNMYCATLHPREVEFLREQRRSAIEELLGLRQVRDVLKARIAELKEIGPLPADIAQEHR